MAYPNANGGNNHRSGGDSHRSGGNYRGGGSYHHGGGGGYNQEPGPAMATAPYNFVSLPTSILPAPIDAVANWHELQGDKKKEQERFAKYRSYIKENGKYTGEIALTIEAITPLYIAAGTGAFFAPLGRPVIPGSTLRGMTKNILKIISCGAMRPGEDLTERNLQYRSIGGRDKKLRDHYKESMLREKEVGSGERKTTITISKAKAGFLVRKDGHYFMCPAEISVRDIPEGQYRSPRYNTAKIDWHEKDSSADIITSRAIKEKKHYIRIEKPDWNLSNRLEVPDSVIKSYREDKSRGRFDLLKEKNALVKGAARGFTHLKDIDFVVPCCYLADNMRVKHFGHGRYYRISYGKSIGDHIPAALRSDTVDFATAIFGDKDLWAGRVFFDDAALVGDIEQQMMDSAMPRPLMQPNPTSYQLYLEQTNQRNLNHWDDDARLRGYKLYWHQQGNNWHITAKDKVVKGMKAIQPVKSGSKFTGKIRFRNLGAEELGALLSVFALGTGSEDICYKIGQGKSIGLGSVRITAELRLEDTDARYQELFSDAGWNDTLVATAGQEFISRFTDYRAGNLTCEQADIDKILAELYCMLDYNNVNDNPSEWKKKVAMMPIGVRSDKRYQDRIILKPALEFVRESFK